MFQAIRLCRLIEENFPVQKFIADRRNPSTKRRRRVVQKGEGFLPFLLSTVLDQLSNLLMEHVKKTCIVREHIAEQRKKPLVSSLL